MRTLILIAAGVFAACVPAAAQNASAPPGAPPAMMLRGPSAVFPLNAAYHEIGRAEQAGATGHLLEAARTHYRGAMTRYGTNDATGAAAEARLASDLARAALDERPAPTAPTPRDLPPPPALPSMPGPPGDAHGPMGMHEMRVFHREGPSDAAGVRFHVRRGFDATRLAEELKLETGPEARQLAQNAVDANAAAQRAALAGNVAEAARQSRLSEDLMAAVSSLVALNHPELHRAPVLRVLEGPGGLRPPAH